MIRILQIFQGNWWKNSSQQSVWPEILLIAFFTFLLGWFVSWLFRKSYRKLWSYNETLLKDQYLMNDRLRADIRKLNSEKRNIAYELQKSTVAFTELKDVSIKYVREILQLLKNEMTRTNLEKEEIFTDLKISQKNNEVYLLGLRQSKEKNRELEENLRGQLSIYEMEKTKWSGLNEQLKQDFQTQVGNYKQRLDDLEGNYDFELEGNSTIRNRLQSAEQERENLRQELEKTTLRTEDLSTKIHILRDDNQTLTSLLHKTKSDLELRVYELQQLQQQFSVFENDDKGSMELKKSNTALDQEKQEFLETIAQLEAENRKYGIDLNELYHSLQLKEQECIMLQRKLQPVQQLEQEKQEFLQTEEQLHRENALHKQRADDLEKEMEQIELEKSLWEERYKDVENEKNELLRERSDNSANLNQLHESVEKNNGLIKQLEAAGRVVMSEREERKRLTIEHETTLFAIQQKFRNEKQYYEEHIKNLRSAAVDLEKKLQELRSSSTNKIVNQGRELQGNSPTELVYDEQTEANQQGIHDPTSPEEDIFDQNDLKKVYHITNEVEKLFNDYGIFSLYDLSRKTPDQLREILGHAGKHFMYFNCNSWPRQAQLIMEGRSAELELLVNELLESEKVSLF